MEDGTADLSGAVFVLSAGNPEIRAKGGKIRRIPSVSQANPCGPELTGLKERGVKATFFVLGQNIQGKEEILRRMLGEGHLIGNHTFSHRDLTALSEKEAEQEVIRAGNAIYEAAGVYTAFIRPPFGRWPENLDFRMTMVPVLWELKDASAVAARVLEQAEDGEVILMHDCYETSVEAALQIIDEMQKQGFEFVTVDEMVFS